MNKSNKIPMVQDILFVCDRKACGDNCTPECRHTTNPSHAVNFTLFADGSLWEDYDRSDGSLIFEDGLITGAK